MIDWTDPTAEAIDGFTVADIERFVYDDVVDAVCTECGAFYEVEPDAKDYNCHAGCKARGTVTSPLVKLGLV